MGLCMEKLGVKAVFSKLLNPYAPKTYTKVSKTFAQSSHCSLVVSWLHREIIVTKPYLVSKEAQLYSL